MDTQVKKNCGNSAEFVAEKWTTEFPQNFCGRQNFRKISVEDKSFFLEFPKIYVQNRICAEFTKNVCRKHNLCRLFVNKTRTGIRIYTLWIWTSYMLDWLKSVNDFFLCNQLSGFKMTIGSAILNICRRKVTDL